jgi:hypothetical protein
LSFEIWESSSSEWFFIFTIEKRSRKHQEKVHSKSETRSLSDTCYRERRGAERRRVYYIRGEVQSIL